MTLGEFLSSYRRTKKLSQRDLAKKMGVSDMTVSRIEKGTSSRVTPQLAQSLLAFLNKEDLNGVEGASEILHLLEGICPVYECEEQLTPIVRHNNDSKISTIYHQIIEQVSAHGFSVVEQGIKPPAIPHTFDLKLQRSDGKVWIIDYDSPLLSVPRGPVEAMHLFLERLLRKLGCCCCYKEQIHKYSLVTSLPNIQAFAEAYPISAEKLGHDVTLIHYDYENKRMDKEVSLAFFKDGRGIYDLDVDAKKESSFAEYAKWELSLKGLL